MKEKKEARNDEKAAAGQCKPQWQRTRSPVASSLLHAKVGQFLIKVAVLLQRRTRRSTFSTFMTGQGRTDRGLYMDQSERQTEKRRCPGEFSR